MNELQEYGFSFTATTLRLDDFRQAVEMFQQSTKPIDIDDLIEDFSSRKSRTNKRILQEYIKRYEALTPAQIDLFTRTGSHQQAQIALLSCCKVYPYIADFVIEVVREKYLVFDLELTDADYRSFFNSKTDLHPEIAQFAEATLKKGKQHVFKIVEEGGLIDSIHTRMIQPQFPSEELKHVILSDNPNWLRLFLLSDHDIEKELQKW
ncbi:MAG TPA: DUF1819 family protein [Bacteroidales bacterium]|nr:DUF1819 family protein [Bacteroidales bacterium]